MATPPYSPTATGNETRLPNDYWPHARGREDEDPLESLSRRQRKSTLPSPNSPRSPFATLSPQASLSSSSSNPALQHMSSAPAGTVSSPFHDPFASPHELPPVYAPVDSLARSFRLEAPFVYVTRTSSLPRYQLMQEFTRSGRPRRLSIRRLMPAESRSHSVPTTYSPLRRDRIRYDEDLTLYTMACYELPGGYGTKTYEMRGHRSSTLGGTIKIESGKSLWGGKWVKIWHLTKNARKDSLNPDNEARMQKYGYHSGDEWDKMLLFCVKRGVWTDSEEREVAWESSSGEFEVDERTGREGWKRDLAVSCWVLKTWVCGGLRWDDDVKGW